MEAAGLAVGIVNLLPAPPLDGGRLVRALARRHGSFGLTRASGALVRAVILLAGIATVVSGLALGGAWLILLALLLRDAARVSDAELALREALLPVTVREVMTRSVVAVPPDATIAQLAETFWAYHFTSYPVIPAARTWLSRAAAPPSARGRNRRSTRALPTARPPPDSSVTPFGSRGRMTCNAPAGVSPRRPSRFQSACGSAPAAHACGLQATG